ncbi:hypothetical protein BDQ17DRAFT_685155 [Cyathus striatus]|nr:hypothetical protein BDQ17DRAFT_685155 [Cyathus striatus]
MSPWVEWNDGGELAEFLHPRILRSPEPTGKESEVKPHDAEKDAITLLVDPSVLNTLSEGMGIAGTWVQLSRLPSADKKGKKSKAPPTSYWYVQEVSASIPSFWTVPEVIPPQI